MSQIKVAFSSSFKRSLKHYLKKHPQNLSLVTDAIDIFMSNPYHSSLETHKLKGKLTGYLAFSIQYDLRVVFYFASGTEVVFTDLGSHDEVY